MICVHRGARPVDDDSTVRNVSFKPRSALIKTPNLAFRWDNRTGKTYCRRKDGLADIVVYVSHPLGDGIVPGDDLVHPWPFVLG